MKVLKVLKTTCFQSAKILPLLFSSPCLETLYFEKAFFKKKKKKNLYRPQLLTPCCPLKLPPTKSVGF